MIPPILNPRILGGWCLNTALNMFSFRPRHLACRSLHEMTNIRGTENLIRLVEQYSGAAPKCLFDVGANASQWAIWLKRRWKKLAVISFEPNKHYQPIGDVHRVALGDHDARVEFRHAGAGSQVVKDSPNGDVQLSRFDSLNFSVPNGSILKVDTENFTYQTLLGFGGLLKKFDFVVAEVWNSYGNDTQLLLFALLHQQGFAHMQVVDYAVGLNGIMHIDVAFWKDGEHINKGNENGTTTGVVEQKHLGMATERTHALHRHHRLGARVESIAKRRWCGGRMAGVALRHEHAE